MNRLGKMTWVELKLFMREPITIIFSFALPLMGVFVLSEVFGSNPDPDAFLGVAPTDYYVSSYIGLALLAFTLISLPVHLAGYKERGVLRRFRASSVPVWSLLGAHLIATFIFSVLCATLVFVVSLLAYDVSLPASPALLVVAFVLSTVCLAALGVLLGAVLPTARSAQGVGVLLFFIMFYLGGCGPPFDVMSSILQRIGDATPFKHIVIFMQDLWLGFGWNNTEFLIVIGIMVVAVILSVRFFHWE